MKFDMKQFAIHCYLRMTPVALITLALGLMLNYFVADAGWVRLLIKAVVIVCVYLITVFLFGITQQERKAVFSKIKIKLTRK